jgi:rubrerythrin
MFNADEIFEIAERIERNGAAFYRRAAEQPMEIEARQKLENLAKMEEDHELIFKAMRSELSDRERQPMIYDPLDENILYLQAVANGQVFDISSDLPDFLVQPPDLHAILRYAIEREKDSIVFYLGIKEFISTKAGKDRIESIIDQELSHIVSLTSQLSALK